MGKDDSNNASKRSKTKAEETLEPDLLTLNSASQHSQPVEPSDHSVDPPQPVTAETVDSTNTNNLETKSSKSKKKKNKNSKKQYSVLTKDTTSLHSTDPVTTHVHEQQSTTASEPQPNTRRSARSESRVSSSISPDTSIAAAKISKKRKTKPKSRPSAANTSTSSNDPSRTKEEGSSRRSNNMEQELESNSRRDVEISANPSTPERGTGDPNSDPLNMPTPGAYSMQMTAPVYVMDDEDNETGQPILDETLDQPREAPSARTIVPTEQSDSPVTNPTGTRDGANNGDLYDAEAVLDAQVQPANNVLDQGGGCFCSKKVIWISIIAFVVLLIVVVVVSVLVAGGDDGNGVSSPTIPDTLAPTLAPTLSPTMQPTKENCYTTTRSLVNTMLGRREFSRFAEYTLCPRSEIRVDVFSDNDPTAGLFPPIPAQSNILIKCGDDGRMTNRCLLGNGNAVVINSFFAFQEQNVQNVTFEGITFERGQRSLLELYNGGDITFRDCVFRTTFGGTPIEIDFQGWDDLPDVRQVVTFERCIFEELVFGSNNLISGQGFPTLATLIMATHPRNTLIIRDCVFRRNEVIEFPGSYIASLGAQIQIEETCFTSSSIGQYLSPIMLAGEGEAVDFTDGGDNYVGGTWDCQLVGDFIPGPNVSCGTSVADATSCQSSIDAFVVFW